MALGSAGVVVVTDRAIAAAAGRPLDVVVAAALDGGAGAVLLRDKDLAAGERRLLAEHLRSLTAATGAELWVAGDADLAAAVGAEAVHLAAADPWPDAVDGLRRGRSCHSPGELQAAERAGADRATYSPVFTTASKPGYGPPLGLDGLAAGCRVVPGLAVVALGGIGPGRARAGIEAGAAAVALMGAVRGAQVPATVGRSVADEGRRATT